jgi:hypothetical protein
VIGFDWTVSVLLGGALSVHYCERDEAERIAANALAQGGRVTDGPRVQVARERIRPRAELAQ